MGGGCWSLEPSGRWLWLWWDLRPRSWLVGMPAPSTRTVPAPFPPPLCLRFSPFLSGLAFTVWYLEGPRG